MCSSDLGLVDELAVRDLLVSGHIAGAGFDVFVEEPAKQNVLFGAPNLVCTPHLGASTVEAQENVALQVAEQISDYLLTGTVVNALNMPSVSGEDAPRLRPYMKLAEQLGGFAGRLTDSGIKSITIDYDGAVAELNARPLTAIVLMGVLSPSMDSVNMVNAPVIAKERGIEVTEAKHERAQDYQTLIRVTVTTDKGKLSVAGTLFGGDKPRIVDVDGISVEAELGNNVLFVKNKDKPGFIGNLGRTLAEHSVNIATFHLGRKGAGDDAVALINIDQPLSDDVVAKVQALPNMVKAKALAF